MLIRTILLAALCYMPQQILAQAEIDWNTGMATALGIGAPPENAKNVAQARSMAIVAARAGAQKGLVELIQGVQINADVTVQDAMATETIRQKVMGFLRGANISKPSYLSDGSVEITASVPLRGPLANVLLPQQGFNPNAPLAPPQPLGPAGGLGAPQTPSVPTGFIVDAKGLQVVPAMAPRIVDEAGQDLYSTAHVNREYAVQYGVAGYAKNIEAARKNDRLGTNPLMVKGLKAGGKGKTDIVLDAAAVQLMREPAVQGLLQQCRVVIVVD